MSQLKPLSPRQAQVLRVMILHLLEHHTHAPCRTIATAIGTTAIPNVRAHVAALVRKGYVESREKSPGQRTYRIVRTAEGEPFHLGNLAAALAASLLPASPAEVRP